MLAFLALLPLSCQTPTTSPSVQHITGLGLAYTADAGVSVLPDPSDLDGIFELGRQDACTKYSHDACSVSPAGWTLELTAACWDCPECKTQQHNVCAATYPDKRLVKVKIDGWPIGWRWEAKNLCLCASGHCDLAR